MPEGAPTFRTETDEQGQIVYHCLYCEEQGTEHHSGDEALFIAHMHQRHDGRLVADLDAAAKKPDDADHPQGGPPGQTGAHPDHPHGGPPGQTGDHPQGGPPGQDKPPDDIPAPTHPIVVPEEEPTP